MPNSKRQIKIVAFTYWFLLLYVLVALIWWFIALQEQNKQIAELQIQQLSVSAKNNPVFYDNLNKHIHETQVRKQYQYIGEGVAFLVVIFVGATFVYRIVRRRLKLSQQQKNFMMAVTHELKTPIAVAKLNLETLLKRKLDSQQQQKLIGTALQEADRLNDLCSNILVSAQLEAKAYNTHKNLFNLSILVAESIKNFKVQFSNRIIQSNITPEINIYGEPLLLQLMTNNFIDNAIKYSPSNTIIDINLVKRDKKATLTIADYGIGIPDNEKSKIWEKFYRIGNENTRHTKGTGIGLYLCRTIAKDHHATITITNNTPTGSIFAIQFAIAE